MFSYGQRPNYAPTWDAEKAFGCKCDEGYEGYDCSLRSCPTGDDPMTRDSTQKHEKQYFTCTGTAGTFKLKFREQTTAAIQYSATAATVKAALEALTSVGTVTVAFSSGTTVCAATVVNAVAVTFMTELGGAPHVDQTTRKLVPSPPPIVAASVATTLAIDFPPPTSVSITTMTVNTVDAPPAGGTVTITTDVAHDMAATDSFTITDAHGFGALFFEGKTYQVLAVLNSLSFTFTYTGTDPTGTYTGGGKVAPALGGKLVVATKTYTNAEGTLENHVCSDRGLCDTATGTCTCFPGYGSSDGAGGEGKRGDCGYIEPYQVFSG